MTIDRIADRTAICETKARYCRLLDTKQWDAWASVFTEDLILDTSAVGGPPPIEGRDAAIASVRQVIENARTVHQVHIPEIVFTADDSADVIFAMQDRVIFEGGPSITGFGHYTETYRKQDGEWRIARSKLTRLVLDLHGDGAGQQPAT